MKIVHLLKKCQNSIALSRQISSSKIPAYAFQIPNDYKISNFLSVKSSDNDTLEIMKK
jgi:hypothetical protein